MKLCRGSIAQLQLGPILFNKKRKAFRVQTLYRLNWSTLHLSVGLIITIIPRLCSLLKKIIKSVLIITRFLYFDRAKQVTEL